MPAYPGLYPSFLVLCPKLQAVGCHHQSHGDSHQFLRISYNRVNPSTSLPPYSLYKSFLLELVRFRIAWEPSIASSFIPLFIVSAGTGISCHLQGLQLPFYVPTGVIL